MRYQTRPRRPGRPPRPLRRRAIQKAASAKAVPRRRDRRRAFPARRLFPMRRLFPARRLFLMRRLFPEEGSRLPAPAPPPRPWKSRGWRCGIEPAPHASPPGRGPAVAAAWGQYKRLRRESRAVAARSATRVSCATFVSHATSVSRATPVPHATPVSRGGQSPSRPGSAVAPMEVPGLALRYRTRASRFAARARPRGRCGAGQYKRLRARKPCRSGEIGDARFLHDICFPCDACFPRDVCFLCDICFPREGSRLPAPAPPPRPWKSGVGVAVSNPRLTLRRPGAAPRSLRHGGNTEGCGRESRAVAARSATRVSCATFVSHATSVSRATPVPHATPVSRGGQSPSRPGSAVAPMEVPGWRCGIEPAPHASPPGRGPAAAAAWGQYRRLRARKPCRSGEIGDARFLRDICFPCDVCFPRDACSPCDICFPRGAVAFPPRLRRAFVEAPGLALWHQTRPRRPGRPLRPLRHGGNTEGCERESRAVAARSATRVSCETFVSCATFVSHATPVSRGGQSPSRPGFTARSWKSRGRRCGIEPALHASPRGRGPATAAAWGQYRRLRARKPCRSGEIGDARFLHDICFPCDACFPRGQSPSRPGSAVAPMEVPGSALRCQPRASRFAARARPRGRCGAGQRKRPAARRPFPCCVNRGQCRFCADAGRSAPS